MGQSYDSNATYIGWSPYFNYETLATLQASKTIPSGQNLTITDNGTNNVTALVDSIDFDKLTTTTDAAMIKKFAQLVKKAQEDTKLYYAGTNKENFKKAINALNRHEHYQAFSKEAMYKNLASANIFAVSHDIRNRDQAYTAIAMDIMRDAAKKSPKGEQVTKLNMFNPFTKYVMQYQNLVGKNVISVAANGEKVWFNTFYYWTQALKQNKDIDKLKFQQTFTRISGRASGKIQEVTINHIPDLNRYDAEIRQNLETQFGVTSENYVYVDQIISQLLSAATDNAKELILAKINAGTNFARMYIYGIMMGLNINDLVAFMTSPAADLIDRLATSNMFQNDETTAAQAINKVQGIVGVSTRLHGTIKEFVTNADGERYKQDTKKTTYVKNFLVSAWEAQHVLEDGDEKKDLTSVMRKYIQYAVQHKDMDITTLVSSNDLEIGNYLRECQDLVIKLRKCAKQYTNISEMYEDIAQFKQLWDLSSEMSTISSAWLGLNQGIPTSKTDILKRLNRMSSIVSERENLLGIDADTLYDSENPTLDTTIASIMANNPRLQNVEERLQKAYEAGIINNFDIIKYLQDKNYATQTNDYYDLIKGSINVFDMLNYLPQYEQILKLFNDVVTSDATLAAKSRLINTIASDNINDELINGIVRYADQLTCFNFASQQPIIKLANPIVGFDRYFNKIQVNNIDMSELNGMATFKHWIENEFIAYLKDNYSDNLLYKHLEVMPTQNGTILTTDIDLLHPDISEYTKKAYDEILKGIYEFDTIDFKDTGYKISDLLQLYNIINNRNQYGADRLTTIFKSLDRPNSIINKFFKYEAEYDYSDDTMEYDNIDYLIVAAPIVSTFMERFHKEPFIKVKDEVRGFILKRYDARNNQYSEFDLIPEAPSVETPLEKTDRIQNFMEYSPFELVNSYKAVLISKLIDFDTTLDEYEQEDLKNLLINFITSNKLLTPVDC